MRLFLLLLAALPARASELTIRWSDNGGRNTAAIYARNDLEKIARESCPNQPDAGAWADGLGYAYCLVMVEQFAGKFDAIQAALKDEASPLRFLLSLGQRPHYVGVLAKGGKTAGNTFASRFTLSHRILPYYSSYADDFESGLYHEISHILLGERSFGLSPGQIPDLVPQIREGMQTLRKGSHPSGDDVAGLTAPAVALNEGLADAVGMSLLGKNAASLERKQSEDYLSVKKDIPCRGLDSREVVVSALLDRYFDGQRERIRKVFSAINPRSSASYTRLKAELLRLYPEEARPLREAENEALPDSCFLARPKPAKPALSPTLKNLESGAEPGCFDGSLKK